MGYANSLPYQQVTIAGDTVGQIALTGVATDFNIGNVVIPAFDNPISLAYLDLIILNGDNTTPNTNYFLAGGSFGIETTLGVYHAAYNIPNGMCRTFPTDHWHTYHRVAGTIDVSAYITPGATQMIRFDNVWCNSNPFHLYEVYGELRLYFAI